jgi:hypothetical protein
MRRRMATMMKLLSALEAVSSKLSPFRCIETTICLTSIGHGLPPWLGCAASTLSIPLGGQTGASFVWRVGWAYIVTDSVRQQKQWQLTNRRVTWSQLKTVDGGATRKWKVVAAANDSGSKATTTVREGQCHCS